MILNCNEDLGEIMSSDLTKYISIEKWGKSYEIWLKVAHQYFVFDYRAQTLKEAEWYSEQLAIALGKIIEKERG